MKKFIFSALVALMAAIIPSFAQNADRIVGEYDAVQGGDPYKVRVTKNSDGTYKAQIFWVKNTMDPKTGQKRLDPKNPNKSLRNVPCDQIVLFNGLSYNAEKKNWSGTKIYDPQRGLNANVTGTFESDGRLCLKGTVLGISEKVYWTRIK